MICEAIPTQMTLFLQETGSIKILHSQGPGRCAQPGRHAQHPAGPFLGRQSSWWTDGVGRGHYLNRPCWKMEFLRVFLMIRSAICWTMMPTKKAV